tara:strand:- start:698 stop:1048 length:351 start_codon:yes stop_codon:yes gene_type:complete
MEEEFEIMGRDEEGGFKHKKTYTSKEVENNEDDTGMGTKSIDWGKYMDGGDDFRKSYRYNQSRRRNTGPAINTKIGDVYRNKKDFTFLGNYIQDSLGESLERMSKHGTLGNLKKKK